ncbi:MAG: metallophosphoesterase [Trebonia sp.]
MYRIVSDGETQLSSAFRTASAGRVPFRFTSVGDIACGDTAYAKASLNAAASVERFDPVVHLVNGDLSYANSNLTTQPQVRTEYFNNTQLSAANRPWMPAIGNQENEPGNGPQGYLSYQTRFTLPKNDENDDFEGNWYKFKVGPVLFVMLDNNDVCCQVDTGTYLSTGDSQILSGYSDGRQEKWLERTPHTASVDTSVDWIIVVMHQPAMSTSDAEGSDLGIREHWMPLFYKYGVDFVLAGHQGPRPHGHRHRRHQGSRRLVPDRHRGQRARGGHQRLRNRDRDSGHPVVGGHRPRHHLPVGHRRVRCRPRPVPRRQDHDDLHLLSHPGRHGHYPVPGPGRVRHLHRDPDALGRLRLPPASGQVASGPKAGAPSARLEDTPAAPGQGMRLR